MTDAARGARRRPSPTALAFAAVCYVPLILTQPGWVSADTKTYLYLDPGRLLSRAASMWDPHVGLGTVSHQTIGYLWPMGTWFWSFEQLGVPDWLAQRLWWGTLLLLAGLGVRALLRRFDWPLAAVWPAAFAYALSPYVLTHIGRLSAVLLPFVGLPWLLAFTISAVRTRGWRHPALFALTIGTVGSINLTAAVLVAIGPICWLAYALVAERAGSRAVLGAALRLGLLSTATSLWWLAGLSVQASNGIDIVRFTESAEVVASTSGAQEVLRGLGYWFFYGGDQLDPWVTASEGYTQWPWLLALTFTLPVVALAAGTTVTWRHRAFFTGLVVVGTLAAVGAHRWNDPAPLGHAFKAFLGTERGLAFRSLPRAVPLLALGTAVLIGSAVGAAAARWPRRSNVLALLACAVAVGALAPLWQGDVVGSSLRRREDIPTYWRAAAGAIDEGDDGTRVLELPGIDFADYRWGATVDPITPGLVDRPYVAREHVPYGSDASANLLNALDLGLQERTISPASIVPLARLLRAGDLVVRSDLQYERYNTARPRLVWDLLDHSGTGAPRTFGPPVPNQPPTERQLLDEAWLTRETGLPDPPAVGVFPVSDVPGIVATKDARRPVVLAGDGTGIVDAAAAGLIDGTELIHYSASLSGAELADELARGARLVLTDSNRRRGERWSTVRHTRGYTEPSGFEPLVEDPTDNRLRVFSADDPDARTVAEHRGGITARATSYGNPITFAGEQRPTAAVDGDPATAWQTGAFSDARGARLRIDLTDAVRTDRLRLLQPQRSDSDRVLTDVLVRLDDGRAIEVALGRESLRPPGQLVTFDTRAVRTVEIELVADTAGDRPRFGGVGAVGFAEVSIGDGAAPVVDEVIRLPRDLLERAGGAPNPLSILVTRIRQDPTDVTREDEERAIVRTFELAAARTFRLVGAARLSGRAPLALADDLVGQTSAQVRARATTHVAGSLLHRPSQALDGDPTTAWASEFGETVGAALTVQLATPRLVDHLDLQVVDDGRHSVPTELAVSVDGREVARAPVVVAAPASARPGAVAHVPMVLPPTVGRIVRIEVTKAAPVTSINWSSGAPLEHPVAIAEVGLPGAAVPAPVTAIDTGCRTDLLEIDEQPVPVRISGPSASALSGAALTLEACGEVALGPGSHDLRAAAGHVTGLDLDQLALVSGGPGAVAGDPPTTLRVLHGSEAALDVQVPATPGERWLILGASFNDGWTASIDGEELGAPELVDGYANGWLLPAGDADRVVQLRFRPQDRVDLALAVSAIAALLCLALAWRGRADQPEPAPIAPLEPRRLPPTTGAAGPALTVAIALVALGSAGLVVAPPVAVAIALATALAVRARHLRFVYARLPAVLLAVAGAYVVTWQVRYQMLPGLEWPGELDRAHPVAMAAVATLALDTVVGLVWRRRDRR